MVRAGKLGKKTGEGGILMGKLTGSAMGKWKKTNCCLCSISCGLEVEVENNKIIRAKGDPTNPCSRGHACRKGRNIAYFQHNDDRVHYPMKRVGENQFERISWDQALDEIAAKMRQIVDAYGPRALAGTNMGQFIGQLGATYGVYLLKLMGTKYRFSNLAAELTGLYWSYGVMLGHQGYIMEADDDAEEAKVLICAGWNGYVSNNSVNGKRICSKFARDPSKTLVVIDPRKSETAQISDLHLAIRPGTDTVFWRAVIALLIQEKWCNQAYMDKHISDFEKILPWFEGVDVRQYAEFCELDYEDVYRFTKLMATKRSCIHYDLGVICGRNSTVTTHLGNIAMALCGHMLMPGGIGYAGKMLPRSAHTDTKSPDNWRLPVTGYPGIIGLYPTAAFAEEVDNDHPQRIRALINGCQNSLNSYVDTPALEKALQKLELLVTVDCQMSEMARISDYVLPMRSAYESWDANEIMMTFPYIYSRLHAPVVESEEEVWESADIYMALMERLHLIPEFPENLYDTARGSRMEYQEALLAYLNENPQMRMLWPIIVAKTLGPVLGSNGKAAFWGSILFANDYEKDAYENMGYKRGPSQVEEIYQDVINHPGGLRVGKVKYDDLFKHLKTPDKKIHLYSDELEPWIFDITPEKEEQAMNHPEYKFVLFAGRHCEVNANGVFRGQPGWVKGKSNLQSLYIHPDDAASLGIKKDGQTVRLSTENGHLDVPAQITQEIRKGCVQIPHGFGMRHQGIVNGVNLNLLTKNTNRDPMIGTPYLRYVPCNVETIPEEVIAQ